MGTARYLAPEQVNGRPADARTDVYALGLLLYEMLCGRPPFGGDTDVATAMARLTTSAPPIRPQRPDVPQALDDVVHRCLARDPARRYRVGECGAIRARCRSHQFAGNATAAHAAAHAAARSASAEGAHRRRDAGAGQRGCGSRSCSCSRSRPRSARSSSCATTNRTVAPRNDHAVDHAVDHAACRRYRRHRRPRHRGRDAGCVTTTPTSLPGHRVATVARWRRSSTATPTACMRCVGG